MASIVGCSSHVATRMPEWRRRAVPAREDHPVTAHPAARRLRGISRRAVVGVLAATAVLGLQAGPASAHARLERTVPSAGASVDRAPSEVRLVFAEDVRIPSGGVRVLDESAHRRNRGRPREVDGAASTIAIPLDALGPGAYVVSWRAVSADGHPIRGAFTFRVGGLGDQQRVAELGRSLLDGGSGSGALGVLFGATRAVDLACLVVVVGLALHAALSPSVARRRVLLLARGTRVVTVVAGLATVLLFGPYASGTGLSGITQGALLDDTLGDRVGRALLLRTVLGAVVATLAIAVVRSAHDGEAPSRRPLRLVLVPAALALALAQAFTGHGATGRAVALSTLATVVHVLAAGAWVGGLVVLAVAVLRADDSSVSDSVRAVNRWSGTLVASVSALVLTGLVQVWRQVGSLDAARDTTYGRLLIAKTVVVLLVLAIGAGARRTITMEADAGERTIRSLRQRVGLELVGAVAIVILTSLLVDTAPAREALARPVTVTLQTAEVRVDATVAPARRGRNEIHLYLLDANGLPKTVREVRVTAALPNESVEPIELRTLRAGPNHFQVVDVDLPIAGTWQLTVAVRVDEFTESTGAATVTIR